MRRNNLAEVFFLSLRWCWQRGRRARVPPSVSFFWFTSFPSFSSLHHSLPGSLDHSRLSVCSSHSPFSLPIKDAVSYKLYIHQMRNKSGLGNSDALSKWSKKKKNTIQHTCLHVESLTIPRCCWLFLHKEDTHMKSLWVWSDTIFSAGASRAFTLYDWLYFNIRGSRAERLPPNEQLDGKSI